jgi:glucose-6-phosphate isomerase, archaeal
VPKFIMISVRKLSDLKEYLKDPSSKGPEDVYYMFRGNPCITVLMPGFIGEEYTKTAGHYHKNDVPEKYEVLFGEGIFILQKREITDIQEDVRVIRVIRGDVIEIPSGWGHTQSNTGTTPLITFDTAPENAETAVNEYEPIKSKSGFFYYVVEEKGEPKLIKNPAYGLK